MDRIDKSIVSMTVFLILVVLIGVFGFIAIKNNPHQKKDNQSVKTTVTNDYHQIKLDTKKDFIYFTNYQVISEDLEIYYSDINININSASAKELADNLNNQTKALANNIKYISQTKVKPKDLLYNVDDIYSAMTRDYQQIIYGKYLSIIVDDSEYNCTGASSPHQITASVFDLETGNILNQTDLLNLYHISLTTLYRRLDDQIATIYNANQSIIEYQATIDQTRTPNGIVLYVDDEGHLNANILVITNEINYNENIVIE